MTKKKTSIELAYERLREELLSCRVMPDDRLKIIDLAGRFGVSPPSVREALSRLAAENLVIFEPLKGYRAAPISCAESSDLLAARVEIESLCLRLSIESGDAQWEKRYKLDYRAVLKLLQASPERSLDDVRAAQRRFLDSLVAGCKNKTLLQVRAGLLEQSQRYLALAWRFAPAARDLVAENYALLEAMDLHNVARGVEAIERHVQLTRHWILEAMESDEWKATISDKRSILTGSNYSSRQNFEAISVEQAA